MADEPVLYAFRCRNCNSLEEAAHAGENTVPRRCRICGAGGSFDPKTGLFVPDPDNWIVLADLPDHELAPILEHHAIAADEIVRHEPFETTVTIAGEREDVVTHDCSVCGTGVGLLHVQGEREPTLAGNPRHYCAVCAINRPGTTEHEQGKTDIVLVPVYDTQTTPLEGEPPPRTPKVVEVTAEDGTSTADKAGR